MIQLPTSSILLKGRHIHPFGHLSDRVEVRIKKFLVTIDPGSLHYLELLAVNHGCIGRL